jgi:hypothetical protein
MAERPHVQAAHEILSHATRAAKQHAGRRAVFRGTVSSDGLPSSVKALDGDYGIDAQSLVCSQWVVFYNQHYGIKAGDQVLLFPSSDHDYIVFDVVSSSSMYQLDPFAYGSNDGL